MDKTHQLFRRYNETIRTDFRNVVSFFKNTEHRKRFGFQDFLVVLFLFLIPLTHKEMFSIYDQDLVLSKFILIFISIIGFFYFLKYYKEFGKDIFYIFLSSILFGQIFSFFHSLDQVSTVRMVLFQSAVTFSYPFFRKYTDREGFRLVIGSYLVAFYFVFLFFLYQVILKTFFHKLTGGIWPVPGYPTRFGSTFWDINHYAAYLASLIFLFLGYFFYRRNKIMLQNKREKVINLSLILASVLAFIGLMYTDSRSGMLGFISGAILFFGFYFQKNLHALIGNKSFIGKLYHRHTWFLSSLAFPIAGFGLIYIFQDFIRKAFLYRSTSFFSHFYLLKAGVSLAIENFSTGIGANAFYAYFKQSDWASAYYYIDKAALNYKLPLHNLWLEVLVETGLISFIFFSLMWIVSVGLLIKLFRKRNDYLALGFASGIIVFLVGGLFYSYKSEFFWIYVVIAFVYGSKDLDENVIIKKFKDAKYIFYYIFESDHNFRRLLVIFASIFVVLSPLIFITNPLSLNEIETFYRSSNVSPLDHFYTYLINLMRYIFGNYSFTGRIISVVFYLSSFLLLISLFSRLFKFYKSVTLSSLILCFLTIYASPVYIDSKWLYIFLALVVVYLIVSYGLYFRKSKESFDIDYRLLAGSLLVAFIVSIVDTHTNMSRGFDKDMAFIVELAANRSVLNNSDIWIENEANRPLVKYYSDHVERSGWFNQIVVSENVRNIKNIENLNVGKSNVFIVTDLDKSRLEQYITFNDVIRHRNYYILILD